jgi:hypothetical protein
MHVANTRMARIPLDRQSMPSTSLAPVWLGMSTYCRQDGRTTFRSTIITNLYTSK